MGELTKMELLRMWHICKEYSLSEMHSAITGGTLYTWYRADKAFYIDQFVIEGGVFTDKFRILPNTNDMDKVGHIDFTKLIFTEFVDAARIMVKLKIKNK